MSRTLDINKEKITVNENSTLTVEFPILDEDGVTKIPAASILTATLTLKNSVDGEVINSRSAVSVVSSISAAGDFSFMLTDADNIIKSPSRDLVEEVHDLIIIISATSGTKTLKLTEVIKINVTNHPNV